MQFPRPVIAQVDDSDAERRQDVGDEAPVTAPPQELGAHDRGPKAAREHQELIEAVGKLVGCGVIGVGAEGRMPPSSIH